MKRALFHDDASPRLAIGLMSGTSADGIDAALVEISGCSTDTRVRLLSFLTLPFSDAARARILRVAAGDFGGTEELCLLNFYLGELSADACEAVCAQAGVAPDKVSFVGSHGQTVFHAPDAREYLGRPVRGTLQTGEASVIAERLGCPVVSDFRVRDMAAGGLGAPLVPYTEYLLYRDAQRTVGLQNIGGIGNITVLPKGCSLNDVFAFDTGPGNMVMDALAARLTEGKARFDDGGRLAAQGTDDAGPIPERPAAQDHGARGIRRRLCGRPVRTCPDAGCFPAGHAVHRDALYSRVHPGGCGTVLPSAPRAADRGRRRKHEPCAAGPYSRLPARLPGAYQRAARPGQQRQGGSCLCRSGKRSAVWLRQQRARSHRRRARRGDGENQPVNTARKGEEVK